MYHAACKVEFQPFKRWYSQLTFLNFLLRSVKYSLLIIAIFCRALLVGVHVLVRTYYTDTLLVALKSLPREHEPPPPATPHRMVQGALLLWICRQWRLQVVKGCEHLRRRYEELLALSFWEVGASRLHPPSFRPLIQRIWRTSSDRDGD